MAIGTEPSSIMNLNESIMKLSLCRQTEQGEMEILFNFGAQHCFKAIKTMIKMNEEYKGQILKVQICCASGTRASHSSSDSELQ